MADTPRLEFPEISSSQSQKEVTHNEALKMLDAFVFSTVQDKDLTAPPGGEAEGQCWIVGSGATGAWATHDDDIAQYYNAAWVFYTPSEGWRVDVKDEDVTYRFSGSAWEVQEAGALVERNADITLFPEYPGAVMAADGGDNDPGTLGMTSDSEVVSNVRHNYYQWISDAGTIQDYDILVKIPISHNFTGFQVGSNVALTVDIKTEENATTNNKIDITLQKDGSATTSALTAQKSASAATWETVGFDETDTVLASLAAGDALNVALKLYSNNKYARVGKINLKVKVQ